MFINKLLFASGRAWFAGSVVPVVFGTLPPTPFNCSYFSHIGLRLIVIIDPPYDSASSFCIPGTVAAIARECMA